MQTLNGIRGSKRLPLLGRVAQEGEEPRAGFFQAVDDVGAFQPPFAHEGLVLGLHVLDGFRIDHVSPVARLSRRTRTTVPSRMRRTMSSFDRSRFCQASQSVCTLCQARLTMSLPMAPPNSAASARRTRRVLVPAR